MAQLFRLLQPAEEPHPPHHVTDKSSDGTGRRLLGKSGSARSRTDCGLDLSNADRRPVRQVQKPNQAKLAARMLPQGDCPGSELPEMVKEAQPLIGKRCRAVRLNRVGSFEQFVEHDRLSSKFERTIILSL